MTHSRALVLALAIWSLQPQPHRTVIAVSRALDGRGGVLTDTRIVVEGTKIAAIDPSAAPIDYDLRGLTVMPGWIDTHVHLSWHFDSSGRLSRGGDTADAARATAENARVTLLAGFTTVQSLGAPVDRLVRDRIERGEIEGPRVLTSLVQINDRSASPETLRVRVRQILAQGADLIKAFATEGYGSEDVRILNDSQLAAVCGEAKAAGARSAVHAISDKGVRAAVDAGCTSIEHGTGASDATLDLMAQRGTYFDPNLLMLHNYVDNAARFGFSDEILDPIRRAIEPTARTLRRARARHVQIVFGTDAVAGAHGRNAEEFVYRVREAHEKPMDALVSAASLAARSLGFERSIGAIAPGHDADVVATDGNPLDDITAVRRVTFVMKSGRVYRSR